MIFSSLKVNAQITTNNDNDLIVNDSIIKNDSITKNISNKSAIKFIINHTAEDYILQNATQKKVTLYNKAHVIYDEYDITAGTILIDYKTNTVKAKGIFDENDKYTQLPVFKTKVDETTQDSLVFNYKSKKAIIYGLETQQDGINTLGQKTKRVNDSTIFVRNIIFTTSDPRNPDYYLKTSKAKIVPGKKIITGATNLVLADVPTPFIFPFAYFPLTKKRTSGIIFPTYGESFNQGFFLQNGGYYLAINDYFDLKLTGDIYSNSSWGFNASSRYKVRYKFNGSFSFNYDNIITGIEGFSNYSVRKNFNLQWNHNQDSKSSPNSRFSGRVNLGSSQYFRQSVNEFNTGLGLQNTLSSAVSYYKKFVDTPFNMNITATHRQNTNTQIVYLTLPSLQLNMDRQYPFAPKNGTKKNALQKIGLTYSLQAENSVETSEEDFFSNRIFNNAKNGIKQNIDLSTNMKVLKYFSLSPRMSYKEIWYFDGINKQYNTTTNQVETNNFSGFNSFRDYNASASLSTAIYGLFKFKRGKLKAIRHTMRPSISYRYKPDFGFYYEKVQNDATGNNFETYSRFDEGIYGRPSRGLSKSLGFGLSNSFEGKIADKNSTDGKDKKINLLNALNLSTSYNFAAENFKLSPLSLSTGAQLFKKLNVNLSASLNPYYLNDDKKVIDAASYKNGGPLFRITRANLNASYSISSKELFKKKNNIDTEKDEDETTPHDQNLFGEDRENTNAFMNEPKNQTNKQKETAKNLPQYISTMPWSIRLSYTTNYNNSIGQKEIGSSSLVFSGDIELSPGWKIGGSSGYDFTNKGITYTNLRFSRDLKSWSMNFNWVPPLGNVNSNSSYYFFIGVKASVLSDLKWDKREFNRDF